MLSKRKKISSLIINRSSYCKRCQITTTQLHSIAKYDDVHIQDLHPQDCSWQAESVSSSPSIELGFTFAQCTAYLYLTLQVRNQHSECNTENTNRSGILWKSYKIEYPHVILCLIIMLIFLWILYYYQKWFKQESRFTETTNSIHKVNNLCYNLWL